jgi:multimeric flavodoxin WrbA
MKIIAFNGSPHAEGNTAAAIRIVAKELEADGMTVETVHVGKEIVRGCTGCGSCRATRRCIFDDDLVNPCIEKVNAADGVILASPTYYAGIAGTMKSFLDRLFFAGADLRYKAAAAVVAVRRSGGVPAFQQLTNYLNLAQAVIVPSFYWTVSHGLAEGSTVQDEEGAQILENVGRNMVWLMRTLEAANEPPPHMKRVRTNFVR